MDHTQAMIDYGLQRYRRSTNTDATARAFLLKWFQQAEDELVTSRNWFFRDRENTLAVIAGQNNASVSASDVLGLVREDGRQLDFIHWGTYREIYMPVIETGPLVAWTRDQIEVPGYTIKIYFWPYAEADETLIIRTLAAPATLADSAASQSTFPPTWRQLVVLRGLELMAQDDGKPALAQSFLTDRQTLQQTLITEDDRMRRFGL